MPIFLKKGIHDADLPEERYVEGGLRGPSARKKSRIPLGSGGIFRGLLIFSLDLYLYSVSAGFLLSILLILLLSVRRLP